MGRTEKETLEYIYNTYHKYISEFGQVYNIPFEVIAGIMCRETEGGLSKFLDIPGPEGRGDNGHGHGLMQIDDRWWPHFISTGKWADAEENIRFGTYVLYLKLGFFSRKLKDLDDKEKLRLAIASYNAGEGNVLKSYKLDEDIDSRTAHGNYSKHVLKLARMYKSIVIDHISNTGQMQATITMDGK